MCNKDHKVNFHQDLCEIINKKRKVVIIGNRTIDNFYAINLNSRTPLMRCREKLNPTKLQHRRLSHINYRHLVHLANTEKVRGIPRLSGEPKPICGESMKGKQTKNSHKKVKEIRTTRLLDILHMDPVGLVLIESRGGKRYILVVVYDF